jgi:hypothetical protein
LLALLPARVRFEAEAFPLSFDGMTYRVIQLQDRRCKSPGSPPK